MNAIREYRHVAFYQADFKRDMGQLGPRNYGRISEGARVILGKRDDGVTLWGIRRYARGAEGSIGAAWGVTQICDFDDDSGFFEIAILPKNQ